MIKLAAAALFASTLTGCLEPPTVGTDQEESRWTFGQMVAGTFGLGGLNLWGYGCYCGPDNEVGVIPIDEVDSCCMTHDHAWMDAGNVAPGCDCNTQHYNYTRPGGVITCTPAQSACAMYCCEADKAFNECVQAAGPLNPANGNYDRTTCEPLECIVDEDCDAGLWCNGGRCVPYCGGGGLGHDLAGNVGRRCADPVDDGTEVDEPAADDAPVDDPPVAVETAARVE